MALGVIDMSISIIRPTACAKKLGWHISTVYDRLSLKSPRHDPSFPRPIRLGKGARAVGFIEAEVDAWIENQAAARDGIAPKAAA
jgi:prophage regulatory protein